MKVLRPGLILSLLICGGAALASAQTTTYYASSAAGSGNGSSCANAKAYGSSETGTAGSTLTLCGTFSTGITLNGSGTSSSPLTLAFDCASQASISMPALPSSGAIVITGNYVTVDGQGCGFTKQGGLATSGQAFSQVVSTSNCQSGCSNSQISMGVIANSGNSYVTVKNMSMGPFFLHNSTAAVPWGGAPYPVAFQFNHSNGNITADNNFVTDCAWCFTGFGNNITVSRNYIQNFDHGLGMGIDSDNPDVQSNVYFWGNSLSNAVTWDTTDNEYHHDGLHLWAYCSNDSSYCAGSYWNTVYVYNNHFFGDWGTHPTGFLYFEENIHNAWVFNNWFDCSNTSTWCNTSLAYVPGVNVEALNNTYAAYNGEPGAELTMGGPDSVVENNVFTSASSDFLDIMPADTSGNNITSVSLLSNDVYMNNLGENGWTYLSSWFSSYSKWAAASGETSGTYAAASTVSLPSGQLATGSPAIQAGVNLASMCTGQPNPGIGALCSDAAGNPRPGIGAGAWDAGAFSYGSVPTGLTGTVTPQ